MDLSHKMLAAVMCIAAPCLAQAQEAPLQPRQQSRPRVEAQKKETVESWSLSEQMWDFKDILTAYEPIKGYVESRDNRGQLAVWKLKLVKDLEDGAAKLHEELRGSPFKIVLLDEERTVINSDLPANITPVAGKIDDTIEVYVALPAAEILRDVKFIRVQRRTDVGF